MTDSVARTTILLAIASNAIWVFDIFAWRLIPSRFINNNQRVNVMKKPNKKPAIVSAAQVNKLMEGLQRRMMLVTDETLNHLRSHGVIPEPGKILEMARADGCCKPDGGTCCPNKKSVVRISERAMR